MTGLRRTPWWCLIALAAPLAGADWQVTPRTLSLSAHVRYLLGDPRRPVVDADARRALLQLELTPPANLRILGWQGLAVDACRSDAGDALRPTMPAPPLAHPRPGEPIALTIGLPAAVLPYRGLQLLHGQVTVVVADAPEQPWEVPLSALTSDGMPIDGSAGLRVALVSDGGGPPTVRLDPGAAMAVTSLQLAEGSLRPRPLHLRWATALGAATGSQEAALPGTTSAEARLVLRYVPRTRAVVLPIALAHLAFGITVPSAAAERQGEVRGADEL